MHDPNPWDAWADEYDQAQALKRHLRPSKAAAKRQWHQDAVKELEELGELYGVDSSVVRGW
ncbi:hypothetical protein AB0O76_40690 [Streptomyces sp. NPDC086554]|uniref:hypothetical protein n=1 Tax=Streptomyces sp. NPDC086554 TaxID=3154864 RepID=UPI00343FF5C9